MGFQQEDLIGYYFGFSGCPIVTFKLRKEFNIDSLESVEKFNFERRFRNQNVEKTSILHCKIRGIRTNQKHFDNNYKDEGIRWVKIEGCEYRLEEKQIINWLSFFGEIRSEISEDTHEESDDSSDCLPPVGNGIYSLKMKLSRDMPQLIPMHGKKIRLYYRGIIKRCSNCFEAHQRKNCKSKKIPWISYVEQFTKNYPEIPREFYGRWANVIEGRRSNKDHDQTIRAEEETRKDLSSKQTSQVESHFEITEKNKGRTEIEEENETEESEKEEEITLLAQSLVASGVSTKMIEKTMRAGKKENKAKQRGLSLGKGGGRGKGRGKET